MNENHDTIYRVESGESPTTVADVDGDVDGDGDSEVLYTGTNGHLKYVDDIAGSPSISFVRDASGDKIDADDATGVV